MSFCVKCGAYIPMDETICPACGFDPGRERKEAEAASSSGGTQSAGESQNTGETQHSGGTQRQYRYGTQRQYYDSTRDPWDKARQTKDPWETGQKRREAWEEPGAAHQTPRWQEYQEQKPPFESGMGAYEQEQRRRAARSVDNQKLSVLSYLGPLFLIPLFARKDDPFARFHANQGLLLLITEALVNVAAEAVPGFGWLVSMAGGLFVLSCIVRGIRSVLSGRLDRLPLIGDITLIK